MKDSRKQSYLKPAVEVITLNITDIIQTSGNTDLLNAADNLTNNSVWREDWN